MLGLVRMLQEGSSVFQLSAKISPISPICVPLHPAYVDPFPTKCGEKATLFILTTIFGIGILLIFEQWQLFVPVRFVWV